MSKFSPESSRPRRLGSIAGAITLGFLLALITAPPISADEGSSNPIKDEAEPIAIPESTTSPVVLGTAHTFESMILGEERTLNILLPPGYHEAEQEEVSYPVIYLLDGAVHEDYHHVSGLIQFLTAYQLMPPSIFVGIANVDRYRDFSHETDGKRYLDRVPNAGGSEKFIRFLGEEVQPFLESNFRTEGPKTLIGQSMGGLVASEIFFRQPGLFDQYFIVSPSLWWDDSSLIRSAKEWMKKTPERSGLLVLALGTEGEEMQAGVDLFLDALRAQAPETLKWQYLPLPEETHATILHRALYRAFEIAYGQSHPGL